MATETRKIALDVESTIARIYEEMRRAHTQADKNRLAMFYAGYAYALQMIGAITVSDMLWIKNKSAELAHTENVPLYMRGHEKRYIRKVSITMEHDE